MSGSRALQAVALVSLMGTSAPAMASDTTGAATLFIGIPMLALVNIVFGIILLGRPQRLSFGMHVLFWISAGLGVVIAADAIWFMAKSRAFDSSWYILAGLGCLALFALAVIQYRALKRRSDAQPADET